LRKEPLGEEEIRSLLAGRPALTLYATRGRQNKALGIDPARLSEDELVVLMAREPTLIRRPVLVVDGELLVQPKEEDLRRIGEGGAHPTVAAPPSPR
jgi:arsenate reductase-like glutaredoxin family protein